MEKLFSLEGRVNRKTYWLTGICEFGCVIVVSLCVVALGDTGKVITPSVIALFSPVLIWIGVATSVKRCHDLNKSGWWCLVPVWSHIALPFFRGTANEIKD